MLFCSEAYIFISKDEGATWELDTTFRVDNHFDNGYLTNGIYLPAPITFINDGTYLLAGIGDVYRGALYRSTDNGISWSDNGISWPESDSDLTEDFNSFCVLGEEIVAGTDHGVFISANEGRSWGAANLGLYDSNTRRGYAISGLSNLGPYLFASTYSNGIFRSGDDGNSWIKVNFTSYAFQGLVAVGGRIFAAAFNQSGKPSTGGVFVSSDDGEAWVHADADLPDHGVGVICAHGSYLFVGTETAIFFSNDLGSTWTDISNGAPFGGATTGLWTNGTYLFANSGGGVWRYPLSLLPGFSQNKKYQISIKPKGE